MMTQFDEGTQCPRTGSGSGSVWKATRGSKNNGDDEYVINFSHGGVIRFMTAPTPRGPWKPGKGLLSRFCATIREIRDFNRDIYGTNRESDCINSRLDLQGEQDICRWLWAGSRTTAATGWA
eukprot:SAG31_NODE_4193_length_3486_cov_2.794804_4_plen_122_part_00